MPSASPQLRNLINKWFNSIDTEQPLDFLFNHGYTEKSGIIYPPVKYHSVTREEYACIRFLIDEWDFDCILATDLLEFEKS